MFSWTRPVGLTPIEPTKEVIWAEIDRYDPWEVVNIKDRFEQHCDMLKDHDIYQNLFVLFTLVHDCSLGSLAFKEPTH